MSGTVRSRPRVPRGARRLTSPALLLAVELALSPALSAEPPEDPAVLCASIERPDGTIYVELLGAADGPVWLPVEAGEILAIQVLGELDPAQGRAVVRLGSVGRDFSVRPLATYVLPSSPPMAVTVEELASAGIEDPWRLSLESLRGRPPDCVTCQGVTCCPAPGACLLCSLCGKTCRGAQLPERPPKP